MEELKELLIESDILISYKKIEHLIYFSDVFIINKDLLEEPYQTIIKAFVPAFMDDIHFYEIKHLEIILRTLITELKGKPDEQELSNILIRNITVECLSPNGNNYIINKKIYPLFRNKILNLKDEPFILNNELCLFGNLFLNTLVENGEDYNNLNDNLPFFDINYAALVMKIRDIDKYFDKINWNYRKMKKQKLTFEQILNNVHLFLIEDLNKIGITDFTYQQLQTLLVTKEILS